MSASLTLLFCSALGGVPVAQRGVSRLSLGSAGAGTRADLRLLFPESQPYVARQERSV